MQAKRFVFSSITYALRAMSLLKSFGINSRLEKIKNIQVLGSCGYVLSVRETEADRAFDVISQNGIRILDVLAGDGGGML